MATMQQYYGTGRRKNAVARVYVRPGSGQFRVNKKILDEYFGDEAQCVMARQPLTVAEAAGQFDVTVRVHGGGISGQAGAIRHGLARALTQVPQEEYRDLLKKAGFLTRDARQVERKKYGQPGARKRYQYSKR